MHDSLPEAARRLTRLTLRLEQHAALAHAWLADRTPDGYPASSGNSPIGSSEPSSPTLNAVTSLQTLPTREGDQDLRLIHWRISVQIDAAIHAAQLALQLCSIVPPAPAGNVAATIDYELKHGRCEGWGAHHAVCDDLAVTTPKLTVVDGSTMSLCHRCYQQMRRETDPAPSGGRQTRKPQ